MSTPDGAAFDCGTHIYEPRDAMTRCLPERFAPARVLGGDAISASVPPMARR